MSVQTHTRANSDALPRKRHTTHSQPHAATNSARLTQNASGFFLDSHAHFPAYWPPQAI